MGKTTGQHAAGSVTNLPALLGHFHRSWSENVNGGRVEILPAFVDGRLTVPVAETFALDGAAQAYDRFQAGGKLGKIVLLP